MEPPCFMCPPSQLPHLGSWGELGQVPWGEGTPFHPSPTPFLARPLESGSSSYWLLCPAWAGGGRGGGIGASSPCGPGPAAPQYPSWGGRVGERGSSADSSELGCVREGSNSWLSCKVPWVRARPWTSIGTPSVHACWYRFSSLLLTYWQLPTHNWISFLKRRKSTLLYNIITF